MKNSDSIFINLSNHPISSWPDEQLEAAKEYGTPVDLAFPIIDPSASEEEVGKLALLYLHRIMNFQKDTPITVHIMGEMTFTFALVCLLKKQNITCVASCTERIVEEVNGKKISEFHFRKFRKY